MPSITAKHDAQNKATKSTVRLILLKYSGDTVERRSMTDTMRQGAAPPRPNARLPSPAPSVPPIRAPAPQPAGSTGK